MKKTGYKELAKEAGVSFKTVYRVLNHEANVRKETRDRVLEVLSRNGRLDYFPARSGSVVIIANLLTEISRRLRRKKAESSCSAIS